MKKIILLIFIFLLCGCKDKYITCNININNDVLNYKLDGEYKIYYKKSYVIKIEKIEKYSSSDIDVIKYLEESKNIELDNLNQLYGGYSYKIDRNKLNLDLKTDINIKNVDIEKMLKNDYINKYYVNNEKLTLGGIKLFYESKGAKC